MCNFPYKIASRNVGMVEGDGEWMVHRKHGFERLREGTREGKNRVNIENTWPRKISQAFSMIQLYLYQGRGCVRTRACMCLVHIGYVLD